MNEQEPEKKDFWSALAKRNRFDFSSYAGFIFEARALKKSRLWIELRTKNNEGETWYRHSFLVESFWKKFVIPFDKFYVIFGISSKLK